MSCSMSHIRVRAARLWIMRWRVASRSWWAPRGGRRSELRVFACRSQCGTLTGTPRPTRLSVADVKWETTPDGVVGDGMAGDAASGADGAELRGHPSHGVTGEGPERSGGVIFVPNFSLGSVVGTVLAAYAARFFDSVEIVESHHAGKADSPSGTAGRPAERIAATREAVGPISAPHPEQRARGELVSGVPIHSMRLAGVDAEQRIVFGGVGETLTFVHATVSSVAYRAGLLLALRAAPVTPGVMVGLETLLGLDLSGVDEGLGGGGGGGGGLWGLWTPKSVWGGG